MADNAPETKAETAPEIAPAHDEKMVGKQDGIDGYDISSSNNECMHLTSAQC